MTDCNLIGAWGQEREGEWNHCKITFKTKLFPE